MGGVVACTMMEANYTAFHADIAPMQLDVVVALNQGPLSTYEHWTQFLCSMDYRLHTPNPNARPYAICIDKVELYCHLVSL